MTNQQNIERIRRGVLTDPKHYWIEEIEGVLTVGVVDNTDAAHTKARIDHAVRYLKASGYEGYVVEEGCLSLIRVTEAVWKEPQTLRRWETRGGKYAIELFEQNGLFFYQELTSGRFSAGGSGMIDREAMQKRIDARIADSAQFDKITYREVEIPGKAQAAAQVGGNCDADFSNGRS